MLLLTSITLIGCVTTPAPTPSATPAFANEKEAFAAAEKTYRAYNDAVNKQRSGHDDDKPRMYLTGSALENDLYAARLFKKNGVHIVGNGLITSFTGISSESRGSTSLVTALICLNIGATQVLDSAGVDVTPVGRVNPIALEVSFLKAESRMLITKSNTAAGVTC